MKVFVVIKYRKLDPACYEVYKVAQEIDAMELHRDFDGDDIWSYWFDSYYLE